MKHEEDIFARVGKRTPYRVPEHYFSQPVPASSGSRVWRAAAACALLLIVTAVPLVRWWSRPDFSPVYSRTETESADEWTEFAEADIFMDTMNW